MARQRRLRRHGEHLHAKTDTYERLIGSGQGHHLADKHAVLTAERQHVAERRSGLNCAPAWAAARWTVDQAIAARASVIYVEDLRSMEAKGMGRTLTLPAVPAAATALQGTRPAHHTRAEMGDLPRPRPRLWLAGRPRRMAPHRRPRPHPPAQHHR
ncbi:hypothetical protein [Actinoallomurus sp. CA-150999]|uniref:hypothetical protein n=1 Tax=Actinoallomurus sp. CA-150999 TaxID=3239887 RepID=UPI003D8B6A24